MQRVLVTGGTGVLGQALRPQLLQSGFRVRVMSRHSANATRQENEEWAQADLIEGEGVAAAVQDVDVLIHAATRPFTTKVDGDGTRRLFHSARQAGVEHLIYISIVGLENITYSYFRLKLAAEALVKTSGIPWTILRTTQFHPFVDRILGVLTRLPVAFIPTDWQFQSLSEVDAAAALVQAVRQGANGRLPDIGGPQQLDLKTMTAAWLAAQGQTKPIWHLPVPGGLSTGFRQGLNLVPQNEIVGETWADWLIRRYQAEQPASRL